MVTNGSETVATVNCARGTSASGDTKVVCNPDGTWSVSLPICGRSSPISDYCLVNNSTSKKTINDMIEILSMKNVSHLTIKKSNSAFQFDAQICKHWQMER